MYRDYLYSIDLLGRIVNTRRRRRALSSDLRRADGTSKPARDPGALNPHRGKKDDVIRTTGQKRMKRNEEERKVMKKGEDLSYSKIEISIRYISCSKNVKE